MSLLNRTFMGCLNYKNSERRKSMEERFNKLNLNVKMFNGVTCNTRAESINLGHLEIINEFLKSSKDYVLVFEDDLLIHKDFTDKYSEILKDNKSELILFGYLINTTPNNYQGTLWGAQCYWLNREYAQWFSDNFKDLDKTVCIDSLVTQLSKKRMIIYPPLIIEDGKTKYDHSGQQYFHDSCHKYCYNENYI